MFPLNTLNFRIFNFHFEPFKDYNDLVDEEDKVGHCVCVMRIVLNH